MAGSKVVSVRAKPKRRVFVAVSASDDPMRAATVNLRETDWSWLDEIHRDHRINRSATVRRALDLLRESVDTHGVEGPLLGKV